MPQLNPSPWLHIFLLAWISFLILLPSKIISHVYPNTPDSMDGETTLNPSWAWQWQ